MTSEKFITRFDSDGDGAVSKGEFTGKRRPFEFFDSDGDGVATRDEIEGALSGRNRGARRKTPGTEGLGGPRFPKAALRRGSAPGQGTIPWIDTHVHVSGGGNRSATKYRETVEQARAAIGEGGFARAILMPTPQRDPPPAGYTTLEGIVDAAKAYPDRFAFLGGGGSLNPMINRESPDGRVSDALRRRFEQRAERILALGAVGFGEMTALHFSITDNHPFESVPADHPLFLLLADIAARHDVPIDFHMEPVVEDMATPDYLRARDNPDTLKRNIDGFERLLAHNPKAKIVWAHAGTALLPHRTVALTEELMDRHPNLYLQIGVRPGKVETLRILGQNGINREWIPLLKKFSDRIVMGGDQFFAPTGGKGPVAEFSRASRPIRASFRLLLAGLPPDLARKIAGENAVRIYRLDRWKNATADP